MKSIMTLKFLIIILIALLGFSCNRTANNKDISKQRLSNDLENFKTFYSKFKSDSVFQKSRIIFPVTYETLQFDEENSTYEIEKIDSKKWVYTTFYWDPSYAKRSLDAYSQKIEINKDTTNVYFVGVDNGISIRMIFIQNEGKWYYYKLINNSN